MPKVVNRKPSRASASFSRDRRDRLESEIIDLSLYDPGEEKRAIADLKEKFRSRNPLAYGRRGAPAKGRALLFTVSEMVTTRLRGRNTGITQGEAVRLFKDELEKMGCTVGPGLQMTEKVVRDYVKRIRLQQNPVERWTRDEWLWISKYSSEDREAAVIYLRKMLASARHKLRKIEFMESTGSIDRLTASYKVVCTKQIADIRSILSIISSKRNPSTSSRK